MQILISPAGAVRCVYEELLDLQCLGQVRIQRGSHVEPDAQGNWWADLQPVAGPSLGPFRNRSLALEAERHWLETNWLCQGCSLQMSPAISSIDTRGTKN